MGNKRESIFCLLILPVLFLSDRASGRKQRRCLLKHHTRETRRKKPVKLESEKSSTAHSILTTTPKAESRYQPTYPHLTPKAEAGRAHISLFSNAWAALRGE